MATQTSNIKITAVKKGKKVLKKKKATAALEEVIKKMKQIQKEYESISKYYYGPMLKEGSSQRKALSTDNPYYNLIKNVKDKTEKRATYVDNRMRNFNTSFHKDLGDEADYMAKRIAELEKQVAQLKKTSNEDSKNG